MKKIAISLMMLAVAASGFSQKKNVSKAESALWNPIDLVTAKTSIEAAMTDPSTAKWEKTYYIAGNVYYAYYEEEEKKRLLGQPANQAVKNEYLVKAIDAYAKAAEYGQMPDEKGKVKPKYEKEVKANLEKYGKYLINEGLYNYNQSDYKTATNLWRKYLEIPSYPIMKNVGMEKDSLYNEIKYYSVDAANRVPELKPIAVKYMEELKDAGYKAESMYEWLSDEYKGKDDAKYVKTLQEGMKKFPKNSYLMGSLINYYIFSKKVDEAIAYIDEAIKNDPKNAQYYAVKGNLLLQAKKDYDASVAAYNQAAQLDPQNFLAQSGLGLVYVSKAEEINDKASSIKDNKKYQVERNRAKDEFIKAIPYLEKAKSINPKDIDNLRVLRAAYLRADKGAEYNKIDAEIKELEK
ncbi:MAG TPA: tetratricopeptide repeat protein [Paludibacteraceae bacterium]|jgi:tetratricopeptide (TPR) repeat protein|nr:tetratricopeptide repeat protein [Paludibacteraceae bacterium]HOU67429.1 tetratricopeptide repeat protein [Paludibacteraceae bacterium]HQF49479.1 tetratricopeptide repeat protein [Paludibacteraceae bacterium]